MRNGRVDLSFLVPRFLERLDQRLRSLESALRILDTRSDLAESVMRDFHSLAGIGGTYGFPELSRLAREGELLIRSAIEQRRNVGETEAAEARMLVAQMETMRLRAVA